MPAPSLIRLSSTPTLAVDYHDGEQDVLVISFSSIGHDATRAPSPEFVGSVIGHPRGFGRRAAFFMDSGRSWGNDAKFADLLQATYAHACRRGPVRKLVTLGLSMGGYQALIAAQLLPVTTVLAFGPQYSLALAALHPRWQDWVSRIDLPQWPVAPLPAPPCQTFLVHALQDDLDHARRFPQSEGTDHILFDRLDHSSLLPHLKARGCLTGLIDAAIEHDRRRVLRILQGAGGRRRKTAEIVRQSGADAAAPAVVPPKL